jgi:hypothetical protein
MCFKHQWWVHPYGIHSAKAAEKTATVVSGLQLCKQMQTELPEPTVVVTSAEHRRRTTLGIRVDLVLRCR